MVWLIVAIIVTEANYAHAGRDFRVALRNFLQPGIDGRVKDIDEAQSLFAHLLLLQ